MSVINFTRQTNGVKVTKDGTTIHNWIQPPVDIYPDTANSFTLIFEAGSSRTYSLLDTIQIEGIDVTANGAAAICDQLRDEVFPNPAGSGSTTLTTTTMDITDATTLALPSADIVDLESSNASETIDSLSGGTSNVVYELRPAANITALTITGTAAATAAAGDIILPSSNIVLNGSKGDYIKFVKRGTKYYQTDAQQYL